MIHRIKKTMHRFSSQAAPRRRRTASRLQLEAMEERLLLSSITPNYVLFDSNHGIGPLATAGPTGLTPTQIRHAYGFDQISYLQSGYNTNAGAGQTIAIVDAYNDPNIVGDLGGFSTQFGLPQMDGASVSGDPKFTVKYVNGGNNDTLSSSPPATDNGWSSEIALDVEWAHAIAPSANIVLFEAADSSLSSLLNAVDQARYEPGVVAVSMSWGGSEWSGESTWDSARFSTPTGHTGVTFVASSGDAGAPASWPAISPNVLAVGGTTLNLNPDNTIFSETAWNGSGGGISQYEPLPGYQPGAYSNGTATGTATKRMNPDVAYDADPATGVPVYDTVNNPGTAPWSQFGGTSVGAPQWAALIAIINQGRGSSQGTLNSNSSNQTLSLNYALPSTDFHDITSGKSTGSPSYSAGTGYDLVTGRGSPYVNLVVQDLTTPQTPPAAPTSLTDTVVTSSQINLSWTDNSDNESWFKIERSTNGTNFTVIASAPANATSFSVTGLSPNTTYDFQVLATNTAGDSLPTNVIIATTPAVTLPTAPTLLYVGPTDVAATQVRLSWTDNSPNEMGFKIERSNNGRSFTVIATAPANATTTATFLVTGLSPNTKYYFRVRATNTAGDSAPTNVLTITTPMVTYTAMPIDTTLNSAWQFNGGTWTLTSGLLQQTSTADGEKKATIDGTSGAAEITAKVRVDQWQDGEYARAGVSLFVDPVTGSGFHLLFTGRVAGSKRFEFLNDGVAWSGWSNQAGNAGYSSFNWSVGTTYWFKYEIDNGVQKAKVWKDGTTEPTNWMLTFDGNRYGWSRPAGLAGVNGGDGGKFGTEGRSYSSASFNTVTVFTNNYVLTATASGASVVTASASDLSNAPASADEAGLADDLTAGLEFTLLSDDLSHSRPKRLV